MKIFVILIYLFVAKSAYPDFNFCQSEVDNKIEEINRIDNNISNIIVVYDAKLGLTKGHPEVMMDILKTITHTIEDIYILHIPYNEVRVKSFQKIVNYIQKRKENINIYINISTHPSMRINHNIFADIVTDLSTRENIIITYATGNTDRIQRNLTGVDKKKTILFDDKVWEKLNASSKEILRRLLIKSKYSCKHEIGCWNEIICPKIFNYLNKDNLYCFVERKIQSILIKFKIEDKDKVIKYYVDTLNTFSLTALLQSKKDSNIIFVSAHTPFSKEEVIKYGYLQSYKKYKDIKERIPDKNNTNYDNNYSLDCRIKGLVNYKINDNNVRSLGQYPDTNNGTSQAAPAVLAEKVLESIKKEKEK